VINPTVPGKENRDIFEHETTYKPTFQLMLCTEGYTNTQMSDNRQ